MKSLLHVYKINYKSDNYVHIAIKYLNLFIDTKIRVSVATIVNPM